MTKPLIGFLVGVVVLFGVMVFVNKSQPQEPRIGEQYADQGQKHIKQSESHESYNSSPASSGPHYADATAPINWGIYTKEVTEEVFLHNEEHGGVIITYNPNLLSADQITKLQQLFIPADSTIEFKPSRFILAPRSKNTSAIEMASWTWTMKLDSYDEAMLVKFYTQHVNKSPESGGKPINKPIYQTTN